MFSKRNRKHVLCVSIEFFTITAEIHAPSLVNFYGQYADRLMNLKFMAASVSESKIFDNLLS